jgi:hypothetical protein
MTSNRFSTAAAGRKSGRTLSARLVTAVKAIFRPGQKKTAPSPTLMKFLGWIREQLQLEDQQTEDASGSVSNIQ